MPTDHLAVMIQTSARNFAGRTAMRHKQAGTWRSITYDELGAQIRIAAKALLEAGIRRGDKVGLFATNRPEWAIADFAILSIGAVSVPIYATDTATQAAYLARDAELALLFAGGQAQFDKVKTFLGEGRLKKVVVFDDEVAVDGVTSLRFVDFLKRGRASDKDAALDASLAGATASETATLIYTSGTTGDPKGVILTHANFFHQFTALDERFKVDPRDRSLCFLPLSHAYERTWSYYVFRSGAANNYVSDPTHVLDDLAQVKPTVMVSVPLLYEKIYVTVRARLEKASATRKRLFAWALETGRRYEERKRARSSVGPLLALEHALADRLVLHRIRDVLGGPKNILSCGGAPLAQAVEEFFFAAGLLICQGYGLTEAAPMLTCNFPASFRFGTVGKPVRGVELRISAGGEILARGPNIMKGYYNRPEETQKTLVDGWLRTGDVGELDADGFLRITDRVKDLIITATGENVAPQHVESMLAVDQYIGHVVAIGDKRKFLAALVVPQFAALEEYARARNIPFSSRGELVRRPEITDLYQRRIDRLSTKLAPYERIRRFALLDHELTQDGDELTPTQKVRRKAIATKYAAVIEELYRS